jgi:hypothetical protein
LHYDALRHNKFKIHLTGAIRIEND